MHGERQLLFGIIASPFLELPDIGLCCSIDAVTP